MGAVSGEDRCGRCLEGASDSLVMGWPAYLSGDLHCSQELIW